MFTLKWFRRILWITARFNGLISGLGEDFTHWKEAFFWKLFSLDVWMQLRVYYWIYEYHCHEFIFNNIDRILYLLPTRKFPLFIFDIFEWIKKKKFINFAKINFWQKSQIYNFGLNRTSQLYTPLQTFYYPISPIITQYLISTILSKKDCVWNQNFKLFFSSQFRTPIKRNKFPNHTSTLCQTLIIVRLLFSHSKRPSLMI
jgi:hypothetical protein